MANEIDFIKQRTVSQNVVMAGDVIEHTLTLTNNSEYLISYVFIYDQFPKGLTFVQKSVLINGSSFIILDPSSGFTLPINIDANSSVTISYQTTINSNAEKQMNISSMVNYTANGQDYMGETSNTNTIRLANGELTITQTVNKKYAVKSDILTYNFEIENTGTADQTNVNFQNSIPTGTIFKYSSIAIDGVKQTSYNPETGFSLGDIATGEKKTVSFDVRIL